MGRCSGHRRQQCSAVSNACPTRESCCLSWQDHQNKAAPKQQEMALVVAMNAEQPLHSYPFNPVHGTVTWERLEAKRLQKLGLGGRSNRYSRHFNVMRTSQLTQSREKTLLDFTAKIAEAASAEPSTVFPQAAPSLRRSDTTPLKESSLKSNSVAPFYTVEKPTCGYFFSDHTDNRKVKIGIPPSDLVKWRNFAASNS